MAILYFWSDDNIFLIHCQMSGTSLTRYVYFKLSELFWLEDKQTQEARIIFRAKQDENLGPQEKQKDLSKLSYHYIKISFSRIFLFKTVYSINTFTFVNSELEDPAQSGFSQAHRNSIFSYHLVYN